MKTAILWLMLGGFIGTALAFPIAKATLKVASGAHAGDRKAITDALTAQQEAWNRGDVDAFLTGYWRSPDLTFAGSSGVARGWDGVQARYRTRYPDRAAMGQLDFSNLEFRFVGPDAALVLGRWHLRRETGDVGGIFSLVWEHFPEGWKIVHDHTSADETR